jgi:hypothetical protein
MPNEVSFYQFTDGKYVTEIFVRVPGKYPNSVGVFFLQFNHNVPVRRFAVHAKRLDSGRKTANPSDTGRDTFGWIPQIPDQAACS